MRKQGSLTCEKKALDIAHNARELARLAFRTPVFAALRAADRRVLQGSMTSEKKALDRNLMLGELIRLAFRTPVFAALRAADRRVLQGSMTSEKKALDLNLMPSFRSCGGSTRTSDLQVMSLASYQLLHSAMLYTLRGSNPGPTD